MSGAARHFRYGQQGQRRRQRKVLKQLLKSLCVGLQSSDVKQTVVDMKADLDSIVTIKAFHNLLEHHTEEDAEQSRCPDATLFTPLTIGKGSERSLFNLTCPCWSSCSWITILRNFGGQPRRFMISQRPFLLIVSNALVRSTNVTYSSLFCSRHFSWSCLRTKIMSVIPRFALKPHWISGLRLLQ